MVRVSALCSVQCFDTVGWVTERHPARKKTVAYLKGSLLEQMEEKTRENHLTQSHANKCHVKTDHNIYMHVYIYMCVCILYLCCQRSVLFSDDECCLVLVSHYVNLC